MNIRSEEPSTRFDWFSIPQITTRMLGSNDSDLSGPRRDMQNAVDSIHAYVEASDMFLVLCPSVQHTDRGEICNQLSWASRGWCRVELAAAALSANTKISIVMVRHKLSFGAVVLGLWCVDALLPRNFWHSGHYSMHSVETR